MELTKGIDSPKGWMGDRKYDRPVPLSEIEAILDQAERFFPNLPLSNEPCTEEQLRDFDAYMSGYKFAFQNIRPELRRAARSEGSYDVPDMPDMQEAGS